MNVNFPHSSPVFHPNQPVLPTIQQLYQSNSTGPQGLNPGAHAFVPNGHTGANTNIPHPPPVVSSMPPIPYSPDSWIDQAGTPQPPIYRPHVRPPRMELQSFDGDPRNWPMFIQSFKIQVHDAVDSDAVRLTHLRNCLSPDILKNIGEALVNPGLYHFALKELQRKFGNPQIVSRACIGSLLSLKPFKDGDYHSLRQFASTLHSVVATLNYSGYGVELQSSNTLAQLVQKLPPSLKDKWADLSWKLQPRLPTVIDFDQWLDDVSMAQYSIRIGTTSIQDGSKTVDSKSKYNKDKEGSSAHKDPNQRNKGSPFYSVFSTTTTAVCPSCDGSHHLPSCGKFKTLDMDKKVDLIRVKRLCVRCLQGNH